MTIVLIGAASWIGLIVVIVAACRIAASDDRGSRMAERLRAPGGSESGELARSLQHIERADTLVMLTLYGDEPPLVVRDERPAARRRVPVRQRPAA